MASEQSRKATSPTMLNRTEHSFARSLDGAGRSPDRHEHNSMTGKGKGHDRNGKSLKGWRRSCERPISNQRQDDSPPTHSSSLLWLPTLPLQLPTELMHQVLLHADGTTLSAAQVVSKVSGGPVRVCTVHSQSLRQNIGIDTTSCVVRNHTEVVCVPGSTSSMQARGAP